MPSKTTLEQTVEQEELELINPDLCEIYKKKLLSLPNIIKQRELELIALSLLTCPYVLASRELETTLVRSDKRISNDKRTRVESLRLSHNYPHSIPKHNNLYIFVHPNFWHGLH